jgi:hypothetical protein
MRGGENGGENEKNVCVVGMFAEREKPSRGDPTTLALPPRGDVPLSKTKISHNPIFHLALHHLISRRKEPLAPTRCGEFNVATPLPLSLSLDGTEEPERRCYDIAASSTRSSIIYDQFAFNSHR